MQPLLWIPKVQNVKDVLMLQLCSIICIMCAAQASFKTVFKNWPPVKLLHQTNTGQKTAANGRCLSLLAQVAMQLAGLLGESWFLHRCHRSSGLPGETFSGTGLAG